MVHFTAHLDAEVLRDLVEASLQLGGVYAFRRVGVDRLKEQKKQNKEGVLMGMDALY